MDQMREFLPTVQMLHAGNLPLHVSFILIKLKFKKKKKKKNARS